MRDEPRPRLLFVVNDAPFFLSHRLVLATGAKASGFDVHVSAPAHPCSFQIRDAGITFHPIAMSRRGLAILNELQTIASLVALYRAVAPDIVHHVTAKPIIYGGLAARLAHVPAVVNAVSGLGYVFISDRMGARLLRAVTKQGYRLSTAHPRCAMIFQNTDDRRIFDKTLRTKNIYLIPGSGVDLNHFSESPMPKTTTPIVLLPSRMLWDKGVGEFVSAARNLRGRARFVLAGGVDNGNPSAISRERLDEWVREGVVEWWGNRTDMPEVLRAATIVCHPSYREGLPKVLLEACAVGRPIVTTDVPGCRDAVRDGSCSLLVPPRDPVALAEAVATLLDDPRTMHDMARNASRHAQQFSTEFITSRTLHIYHSLLTPPATGVERSTPRSTR